MINQFSRTEMIYGEEGMKKISASKIAIFGIGGVGGYTVEALARSGVGTLDLFDDDKFCLTNLNRQIHATRSSIGKYKVDVAKERIHDISPETNVNVYRMFYMPDTSSNVDLSQYDYVVDAIDTVTGKIELIVRAYECNTPIISSMGAGNKVDAAAFEVADIYKTSVCPLARVIRNALRKRDIPKLKVVYSKEPAIIPSDTEEESGVRRQIPGSNAFVPATAGLIIAGEVINDITGFIRKKY